MDILERLEHFKDYQKNLKIQDNIILGKKETFMKMCEDNVDDEIKMCLLSDVTRAEEEKKAIILDEIRERQELEEILNDKISDIRIRAIFSLNCLHNKTLRNISEDMGLSYDYVRELKHKGKMLLNG